MSIARLVGPPAPITQLSSCWLLGSSEKWETLYAVSQELDFEEDFRKAATVSLSVNDTGGNDRQSFFFCVQMGKRRCSWRAAKIGRQNPPEPRCVGSACAAVLFALLPLGQQVQ